MAKQKLAFPLHTLHLHEDGKRKIVTGGTCVISLDESVYDDLLDAGAVREPSEAETELYNNANPTDKPAKTAPKKPAAKKPAKGEDKKPAEVDQDPDVAGADSDVLID